ncbi:phosphoheptose isomerase [Marinilactibacillus piezotolerans]|uniref:Phosphoheptose isomerase n=1 Tax=Marinilactibacillus piezotolerans TaxID=258723 RepID=A0A1I3ZUR9_9LACT|nr:SIS domain-containing protein [Marinilactibacillus piezotolerans]SFK47914.1 phosphoheptose isomerase [Marinilactibacillus piezotolerans]
MDYSVEIDKRLNIFNDLNEDVYKKMKRFTDIMYSSIKSGNKIMTCGNGGSAANAQHIIGDIIGRYKIERQAFAGLSLTVDPSVMTATGNDYGYDEVFARQVEGLGKEGDVLIVLSSSANSSNIIKAVTAARQKGITTIGVLGNNGGEIEKLIDQAIIFNFKDSDLVEETAMALFHIILMDLEKQLTK